MSGYPRPPLAPVDNIDTNRVAETAAQIQNSVDVNHVPDQVYSFEELWRTNASRKSVACLILKIAFPEIQPGSVDFKDIRVCNIVLACQKAENEAYEFSTSHEDYETRVKDIITSIVKRKNIFEDMARASAGWRRRNRSLPVMNQSTDSEGPLLAVPPPPPTRNVRSRSSLSDQASTEPESSPDRDQEQMMNESVDQRLSDDNQPLFASTPMPGLTRKRHLEPQNSDNHATSSHGGPLAKKPKLDSQANNNNNVPQLNSSDVIPVHLINQEIKTERPSPPASPIPSFPAGSNNHNSMQLALPSTSYQSTGVANNHNSMQLALPSTSQSTCVANRRLEPSSSHLQNRYPKMWRSIFLPIINKLMNANDSKHLKMRTEKDRYHVTCFFRGSDPVTRPFDLNSILNLMVDDDYMSNPWNFITDVSWVLILPTCSPRKALLKKQRSAKTALKNFLEQTNNIMTDFKYCCGRQQFFFPYDLVCAGRDPDVCSVPPFTKYYLYDNTWVVCEKCWNANKTSTVKIRDRRTLEDKDIQKREFTECKNDKIFIEPMVTCVNCRRDYHKICVQYFDLSGCNVYTCDLCLAARGISRQLRLKSAQLPTSMLDQCMEARVNRYLASRQVENRVWVRVVSCIEKTTEIRQGMKELYVDGGSEYKLCESYPYRQKVIFAFEEINGKEVAFFAMYVQEYGSECPPPNNKRVYIAYLDSVHYFQPKECRTGVYHEILLAYLQHTKSLGFTTFHIWACPPNEGNDYIFYAHPPEQKVPKAPRLLDWYRKMLDKALTEGIIMEYKNMCRQVIDDKLESVVQIPYMDGDFWPETFENTIKLMEQEKEQAKVAKKTASKKKKGRAKKPAEVLLEKECENILKSDALSARVMTLVQQHKDLFFIAYLNPPSDQPIVDPDPLTQPCVVDNRDNLLENGRENLYEFSTMRRAIHSTQMLLKECTPGFGDRETYTCNHCGKGIDESVISYTCTKCVDFDVCDSCLLKCSHPHKMRPRGIDIEDEIPEFGEEPPQEEGTTLALRRFAHAAQCQDVDCPQLHCHRMKALFFHSTQCKGALKGCSHCRHVACLVSRHSAHCTIPVSLCEIFKCTEVKHLNRLVKQPYPKLSEWQAHLAKDSTFAKLQETLKLKAKANGKEPLRIYDL